MNLHQQRAEETHARLLKAAEESFAQSGYDGTSVAEICRRAGVTKGGFYHHFPSKQAIFLALLEQWLELLDAQLEGFRTGERPVSEQLLEMAEMIQQVFQEASGRLPMFLEFWNKAARDPAVWEATIAPYRRYRDFFAHMIEEGITNGNLRPVDPEVAAQVVVSLAVGLILQGLMDPQGGDWGEAMREGMYIILKGLEKEE